MRRTQYSPVAVTEVKEGSVSSTLRNLYSTLTIANQNVWDVEKMMLLNK